MENTATVERKTFEKGYGNLTKKNARLFKKELKYLLGDISDVHFYRLMRGHHPLNPAELLAIETLFNKYEVTEIWD